MNAGTAPYTEMGPSMLAAQPVSLPPRKFAPDENWGATFRHLESRLSAMRSWRWTWWVYWGQLAEFFIPKRYKYLVTANTMARGRPLNDAIIDGTGQLAVRTCATGLYSGLTNPARPWFKLEAALPWMELDAEAKEWLEDTEQRLYTILHQSNFYQAMAQAFEDVTVFGTAPVIIYEDAEDVIRCYNPCAGEYYLASGARLTVDTLYREFTFTTAQTVEEFRLENCPEDVKRAWENGSTEQEVVVCHAIEPNFPIGVKGGRSQKFAEIIPKDFVWREVYWVKGQMSDRPLSKRGFNECPFLVLRWSTVSNDAYGRSPCMDALGDTKQIQQETRRKAEFIEKGVRPPMGADPSLKNEPASILPAMITYIEDPQAKFRPLFEVDKGWLPALVQDIAVVSERINEALFVPIFMAITRMQGVQPRNELEITKRDLERLQVLGPFVDRFENEGAGPAIKRVLAIAQRRRLLRPMPESLRTTPLKLNYVSIMKIAQSSAEGVAMKDVLATLSSMSAAAKAASLPDPLRILNLDKTARTYAKTQGFPESDIFTDQQVTENDAARAQGKAQAEVLPTTMAGVQAAKIASETQLSQPSLLSSLMGGGQGG